MTIKCVEWHRQESYTSEYGMVYLNATIGEWVAKVVMPNGTYARLRETYVSAEVAQRVVERTWQRENEGR